jgi:hypothetical protein
MEIFEDYPGLEERLIEIVPVFKKLKNPVLRKTVARIATVQQAATIANIPVNELVTMLRTEANQELDNLDHNPDNYNLNFEKPDWYDADKVIDNLDLGPILEAGEHPIHQVVADLKNLKEGQILDVLSPFLPAPLVDKATSLGYQHYIVPCSGEAVNVYFLSATGVSESA